MANEHSPESVAPPPNFPYAPDAYRNGLLTKSHKPCAACREPRGWLGRRDLCPWCIDAGVAHGQKQRLNSTEWMEGPHDWRNVPQSVTNQVMYRTPGLITWQGEQWWAHCRDAAEFLGYATPADLKGRWAAAWAYIRENSAGLKFSEERWADLRESFDPEGDHMCYVFGCRACGAQAAFWDMS